MLSLRRMRQVDSAASRDHVPQQHESLSRVKPDRRASESCQGLEGLNRTFVREWLNLHLERPERFQLSIQVVGNVDEDVWLECGRDARGVPVRLGKGLVGVDRGGRGRAAGAGSNHG